MRWMDVDRSLQRPEYASAAINQGDDIAGTVHAIGSGVTEFKPGDRVAAFHEMGAPGGSYAEYAVAWDHTTFHIPDKTSFEGVFHLTLFIASPRPSVSQPGPSLGHSI